MNIKTRSAIVLSFLIVGITTQCNSAAIRVSKRRSGTSTHSKSLVKPATLFSDITNPAERLLTPKPPIDIFHSKQQCLTRKLPLMGHHFPLTMESIRGGGKNIENIINIIKLADNPFFLPQPITTEALCFWAKGIGKQFSVIPPLNEGLYRHRNFIPFKQLAYIERAFERWQKIFPGACRHIAFNLYHLKNIIRVQLEGIKKIEQETVLCVLPFFEEAVRLSHDYLSHGESTTSKAISLIGYIYDCDTLTTSQKVSHTHDVIKSFLNKAVHGRSQTTHRIVKVRIAKPLPVKIS